MAVELRNKITNQLNMEIPIRNLIEGATVDNLANLSLEELTQKQL